MHRVKRRPQQDKIICLVFLVKWFGVDQGAILIDNDHQFVRMHIDWFVINFNYASNQKSIESYASHCCIFWVWCSSQDAKTHHQLWRSRTELCQDGHGRKDIRGACHRNSLNQLWTHRRCGIFVASPWRKNFWKKYLQHDRWKCQIPHSRSQRSQPSCPLWNGDPSMHQVNSFRLTGDGLRCAPSCRCGELYEPPWPQHRDGGPKRLWMPNHLVLSVDVRVAQKRQSPEVQGDSQYSQAESQRATRPPLL